MEELIDIHFFFFPKMDSTILKTHSKIIKHKITSIMYIKQFIYISNIL